MKPFSLLRRFVSLLSLSCLLTADTLYAQVVSRSGQSMNESGAVLRTSKISIPQSPERNGYVMDCYEKEDVNQRSSYTDWYFVKNRKTLTDCLGQQLKRSPQTQLSGVAVECPPIVLNKIHTLQNATQRKSEDHDEGSQAFIEIGGDKQKLYDQVLPERKETEDEATSEHQSVRTIHMSSKDLQKNAQVTSGWIKDLDDHYAQKADADHVYVFNGKQRAYSRTRCLDRGNNLLLASLEYPNTNEKAYVTVSQPLPLNESDTTLVLGKIDGKKPPHSAITKTIQTPDSVDGLKDHKGMPDRTNDKGVTLSPSPVSNQDLLGLDKDQGISLNPADVNRYLDTAPPAIKQLARNAALRYQINPRLVLSMIAIESRFNPEAVSNRGAVGLMQLMPATAASLGLVGEDIKNPEKNIEAGVKYLDQMLRRYRDNLPLALAAYNAGYGNVEKAGGIPQNGETPRYVRDIIALFEQTQKDVRLR
jgi:hypothetical protein